MNKKRKTSIRKRRTSTDNSINLKPNQVNSFEVEVSHGSDALKIVKEYCINNPNKLYRIIITYEVLSGKNRVYYKGGDYRNQGFVNVYPNIIDDLNIWLQERGEIYYPEDPLKIDCCRIRIDSFPMTNPGTNSPIYHVNKIVNLGKALYKLVFVSDVLEAYTYLAKGTRKYTKWVPLAFRRAGCETLTDIRKLSVYDQIFIASNIKGKKKGIYSRPAKLLSSKDLKYVSEDDINNYLLLYFDRYLWLLYPTSLSDIDIQTNPVTIQKFNYIAEDIYVYYDTEWNWKTIFNREIEFKQVDLPDILTYCIVEGREFYYSTNYEYKVKVLKGKDCIFNFLKILKELCMRRSMYKIYAIAHNASVVEHTFIINGITRWFKDAENYQIIFHHVSGRHIYSFRWNTIEFRDSFIFIYLSLEDGCKAFNKRYKKKKISREELLKINWLNPSTEDLEYAINDALSLGEMCMNFLVNTCKVLNIPPYNLFKLRSTASIMKWWLIQANTDIEWDSLDMGLLRSTIFFGGRCECFFIGTSDDFLKVHPNLTSGFSIKIDVTSSYPYTMSRDAVPGKIIKIVKLNNIKELSELIKNNSYLYFIQGRCMYYSPGIKYPLIAHKIEGKLIFPNYYTGEILNSFWCFEFKGIQTYMKEILNIEVIIFEKYYGLREKITSLFYGRIEAKKENNIGLAHTYKIMMNSGYGSLALNPERDVSYLVKGTFYDRLIKSLDIYNESDGPNGFKWVTIKRIVPVNTLIFIAAYITSYSRFILWKEMVRISEEEKGIILYCDTDSIIFVDKEEKEKYYRDLYKGDDLGSWKLEGVTDNWEIAGLKVYRFGTDIKYKGIVPGEGLLDKDGKLNRRIDMEVWNIKKEGVIEVKKQLKVMNFKYDKGILNHDGNIIPWDL